MSVSVHFFYSFIVYTVYAALGDLNATRITSGSGTSNSTINRALASQYYNDAAETAMEAGKPKLANKYIENAALYEEDEEEEEEDEGFRGCIFRQRPGIILFIENLFNFSSDQYYIYIYLDYRNIYI
jgi:hypothetical protein